MRRSDGIVAEAEVPRLSMTELHGNGALAIILTPAGDIETVWYAEMAGLAKKGSTVTLTLDDKCRLVVSVERR